MNCPTCRTQVMPGAAFCDNCGSPLSNVDPVSPPYEPPVSVFYDDNCPSCHETVMPGEAFCGNCGTPLALPPTQIGDTPVPLPPPSETTNCSSCGVSLQAGSQFCDNCGAFVGASQPVIEEINVLPPLEEPPYTPPQLPIDTAPASQPSLSPRLVVKVTNVSIAVPSGKSELMIGREDPSKGHFPDIDLTPHGGEEGGVGRRHAKLYIEGYQGLLEDNQSVNGTYVNRQRLQTGQRQPLNNGDELRFGLVVLTYYTA